jgi:short-subunit dehydrogenase
MIHYQDRWAVVTGASSGLGRGLAAGLAARGMSLVLTGRNEARLDETAHQIRRAAPAVKIETVAADLASRSGVSALLDHVGDRPVEVLVNNAGFGSYGPFAEADPDRETEELAVDVGAVVALARAFLPGMLARGSGGILNVASTIAFQPAPYQAVYGANKAFVLSFSQALWAEAHPAGVAVTALCPGPTRTGFVDALGADVGHTAIYGRLADPGPVIKAGLSALDQGRAVVIPGLRNKVMATGGRFMPPRVAHPVLRPAAPPGRHGSPPADRRSQPDRGSCRGRTRVGSAGRRRRLAVVVSRLPVGPGRASRQLPVEGTSDRLAEHRGGQRPAGELHLHCGRPRAARRARVHAAPRARRPGHRRPQP